jgi:hypothetical protein
MVCENSSFMSLLCLLRALCPHRILYDFVRKSECGRAGVRFGCFLRPCIWIGIWIRMRCISPPNGLERGYTMVRPTQVHHGGAQTRGYLRNPKLNLELAELAQTLDRNRAGSGLIVTACSVPTSNIGIVVIRVQLLLGGETALRGV